MLWTFSQYELTSLSDSRFYELCDSDVLLVCIVCMTLRSKLISLLLSH